MKNVLLRLCSGAIIALFLVNSNSIFLKAEIITKVTEEDSDFKLLKPDYTKPQLIVRGGGGHGGGGGRGGSRGFSSRGSSGRSSSRSVSGGHGRSSSRSSGSSRSVRSHSSSRSSGRSSNIQASKSRTSSSRGSGRGSKSKTRVGGTKSSSVRSHKGGGGKSVRGGKGGHGGKGGSHSRSERMSHHRGGHGGRHGGGHGGHGHHGHHGHHNWHNHGWRYGYWGGWWAAGAFWGGVYFGLGAFSPYWYPFSWWGPYWAAPWYPGLYWYPTYANWYWEPYGCWINPVAALGYGLVFANLGYYWYPEANVSIYVQVPEKEDAPSNIVYVENEDEESPVYYSVYRKVVIDKASYLIKTSSPRLVNARKTVKVYLPEGVTEDQEYVVVTRKSAADLLANMDEQGKPISEDIVEQIKNENADISKQGDISVTEEITQDEMQELNNTKTEARKDEDKLKRGLDKIRSEKENLPKEGDPRLTQPTKESESEE